MSNKVRMLLEGAMFVAIYQIMIFMVTYAPISGAFVMIIIPIPIALYFYRNDFNYGIIVCVASFIVSMFFTPVTGFISSMIYLLAGLILGTMLKKGYEPKRIIIALGLCFVVELVVLQALAETIMGYNYLEDFKVMINESVQFVESMPQYSDIHINLDAVMDTISKSIYTMLFIAGLSNGYILYLITHILFKKLKYNIIPVKNIFDVRVKKTWLVLFIVVQILLTFDISNSLVEIVVWNLYLVLLIVFFVNGFSVVAYYLAMTNKPRYFRVLMLLLIFVPIVAYSYVLIGMIDAIYNLRKQILSLIISAKIAT